MWRRNSCSSSAITSYSCTPGRARCIARTCAPTAMLRGVAHGVELGAALEQPHVVQQVIERDELLRRVHAELAPALRRPLTQPITRWSNSGCAPIV